MQLNKSDLKKFRKHAKSEQHAEAELIINGYLVRMSSSNKEEKIIIMSNAHNLVKLMQKRLVQFKKDMAAKYGYDYYTHYIDYKTGDIKAAIIKKPAC